MQKQPTLVVAAVIRKGDHILIAQRLPDSKAEALKWEFPGGKVEKLEHPEQALKREIQEELGVTINVGELFGVHSHIYSTDLHIVLLAYVCDWVEGEARNLEVHDSKWIRMADLDRFEFAAADLPFIEKLKKKPL